MGQFITSQGRRVMPGRATPTASGIAVGAEVAHALQQQGENFAQTGQFLMRQDALEKKRQDAIAEAARKQQDLLTLQQGKDALRDAHDEIATNIANGTLDKGAAESTWAERSKQLAGEHAAKLSSGYQDVAKRELEGMSLTLGNSVRRVVEKRNQSDIQAGIDQTLEYQQRQFATDPAKAQAMAMATLEQLGPFSGWTPEQLQRKAQSWKEGTQFTQAYGAISAGRNDRKALAEAEKMVGELPDLDPQKRAQLMDRAQAYRLHLDQQDELRAQRAQRAADAMLKRAEASFTTFQTLADKGGVLDPAYIDKVTRETAGTPYQAGVLALAKQAVETGGFAAQPIANQRAALMALDTQIAQQGRNPTLDKHREKLERVLRASESDLKADPLNAALQRGVITEVAPLNITAGVAGIVQQLGARSEQARVVETWAGAPVSPLLKSEADNLSGMLRSMPPEQRATALEALSRTMTPRQAQALAGQLDGSDKALGLALAYGSAQTSFDRPVSELILRGQIALKEAKTVKLDDKAEEGLTAQLDKELGGAIANPEQAQRVREAAKLIWAGKASEGQRIDPANAVRLAVGGSIAEHNGAKVVLPAGMDESALRQRLQSFTPEAFAGQLPDGKAYVRGQAMDAAQFVASLPGAQLRTLARGRFAVVSGGAVVTNARMQPVVVEVGNAR